MGQTPRIEAQGLTRSYDGGRIAALRGLDLSIAAGEFIAIVGPSGCGKSTLLAMLGALEAPQTGTLSFDGEPFPPPHRASAFRAEHIGFVFQSFHLLPTLSAAENVEVPMFESTRSSRQRRERARMLLHLVGLDHRSNDRPSMLSGGERQRVAIARALANQPTLLLADEPTGSLDSVNAARVMQLFEQLHAELGTTLVVVTHAAEVAGHAQRVVRMQDGRIITEVEHAA
ncbi:ABC transporter ATP-binding protein [Sinimarinibacterium sp. CAU 1509]|uniref:ABC transporter ATP-binding protein n=1 Tax=Sinimarinibacterium sp. CAU 1509 TaxID=2562283 RepID=UPI0010ABA55B|nr:ABC transporter ATP-binding protein [Sinimarinibacterium sp. CAU 1509]TJY58414.1 ABC transporter ATP-binding protein [Sinimarinibacterium sp. CAU 1509]